MAVFLGYSMLIVLIKISYIFKCLRVPLLAAALYPNLKEGNGWVVLSFACSILHIYFETSISASSVCRRQLGLAGLRGLFSNLNQFLAFIEVFSLVPPR